MIGLSILLLLGVLDWDDCLSEKSAWDTLAWFSVLVGMAGQLTNLGIVSWMSSSVANTLQSYSLSWPAAFCVLQAAYFSIHYLFASQTGHVGALYSAFLAMHLAAGVPGVLAALALAYNTNLFGAITHYSSGQAAVYYGGMLPSDLICLTYQLHFCNVHLFSNNSCFIESPLEKKNKTKKQLLENFIFPLSLSTLWSSMKNIELSLVEYVLGDD